MGSNCTKPSSNSVTNPQESFENNNPISDIHQIIAQESFLDEILYINIKYKDFFSIIKTSFSGAGVKKTFAYKSHISKEDLMKKREEFWDTRTEGNPEAWQTIKGAISNDESNLKPIKKIKEKIESAQLFLEASGLNLIKNSIQAVFDETGNKYETPIFCVNDPLLYEVVLNSLSAFPTNFKQEKITVKIRCAKIQNDIILNIENTIKIQDLKEQFKAKATECGDLEIYVLRMFIKGKEMKDNHFAWEFNLENNVMVQMFLQAKP